MVFFNYALRKLNAKIVYYGPGLCGKTTNLQWIHDHFEGGQKGKMISLSTEGDRTIFFDLLPLDIGTIRGMQVTLQLYTVPGQVHYNSTRQLVLRGADGVVFVADSQRTMRASNVDSLHNLEENLRLQGVDLAEFPHALQFNKRDLRDLLTVDDMDHDLNFNSVPFFEAVATQGVGVQETLEGIVKLVMRSLRERYEPVAAPGQRTAVPTAAPSLSQAAPPTPAGRPMSPPPVTPPVRPAAVPSDPPQPAAKRPLSEPWATQTPSPPARREPPPFELGADQDLVSTGVYSDEKLKQVGGPRENLTTATAEASPPAPPPAFADTPSSPDILGPYSVEPMTDEPTRVRRDGPSGPQPVIVESPDVDPWAVPASHVDRSRSFTDQDTATGITPPLDGEDGWHPGGADEPEFVFGTEPEPAGGADPLAGDPLPPVQPVIERPPVEPPPVAEPEPPPVSVAGERESSSEGAEAEKRSQESVEGGAEVQPPPPVTTATPPRRTARPGSVDDLVASILGRRVKKRPAPPPDAPVPPAEPPVRPVVPPVERMEAPAEPVQPTTPPPRPTPPPRVATPVTVGDGDPFQVDELPPAGARPAAIAATAPILPGEGMVRVGDNQLHLRLQGTGAIAESGQVRALDIEVPVPGSWVGNRRVTLQLRLTLSPAPEDEDGGSGGAP